MWNKVVSLKPERERYLIAMGGWSDTKPVGGTWTSWCCHWLGGAVQCWGHGFFMPKSLFGALDTAGLKTLSHGLTVIERGGERSELTAAPSSFQHLNRKQRWVCSSGSFSRAQSTWETLPATARGKIFKRCWTCAQEATGASLLSGIWRQPYGEKQLCGK